MKSRRNERSTCPCYLTLIRENDRNGNVIRLRLCFEHINEQPHKWKQMANRYWPNFFSSIEMSVHHVKNATKIIFILYFVIRGNQLKPDDKRTKRYGFFFTLRYSFFILSFFSALFENSLCAKWFSYLKN